MTPEGEVLVEIAHPSRTLDTAALEHLARRTVAAEEWTIQYLGIILTNHDDVHALNRDFLGHDWETDVVSFPLGESEDRIVDGEVYVDLDTAAERAGEFGATYEDEARRYAVHGLLHLMGYDDATDAERAAMRALEDRYLSAERSADA